MNNNPNRPSGRCLARGTSVFLALMGVVLLGGGIWLVALGGSLYYALLGAALVVSGICLWRGFVAAYWIYAAILLASVIWALADAGLDYWQLLPRWGLLVLVGLWLLLPWISRPLRAGELRMRRGKIAVAAGILLAFLASAAAFFTHDHDIAGDLSTSKAATLPADAQGVPAGEWRAYGRTAFGQRYSPLAQLTGANVGKLQQAWQYRTGDIRTSDDVEETTYEVTPLKVGDLVYLCTPHDLVIALDAGTGQERWRYDPKVPMSKGRQHQTCRGVSYHEKAGAAPASSCAREIFMPTADARLIALDALSGTLCRDFAKDGELDLMAGMPHRQPGFYYSTSPPVVTQSLIVVGGAVDDNVSTSEPSGVVRAYNIDTGVLVWNWDSKNPAATAPLPAGQTYRENSPNVWPPMSVDEALRMVYLPLGNAPPDQWGGKRDAMTEKFSSSVTALSLDTGEVKWVFQAVHHDLWDMDMPAQPSLIDLTIDGKPVPALVQATKQGDIYVLNRLTGAPLLPVTETAAPGEAAAGDTAAPAQPFSKLTFKPDPPLSGSNMWGATPFDQLACRIELKRLRYEGRYTPPSTQGSLIFPGNFGTFNWGGVAVDPERQVMFAMPVYLAFISRLIPRENPTRNYVSDGKPGLNENYGAPFAVELKPFLSPIGLPCQAPPWGYVAGADLRTGDIAWKHKNGTVRDLSPLPLPFKMGVPGIGGPIMTAGGVAFLSGSLDNYVRAYDVTSGAQLWESRLPAGGQATPMTYQQNGRQYLLVVAGGHGSTGTKKGDYVIAYALPIAARAPN